MNDSFIARYRVRVHRLQRLLVLNGVQLRPPAFFPSCMYRAQRPQTRVYAGQFQGCRARPIHSPKHCLLLQFKIDECVS
jgi:hypothetical protein